MAENADENYYCYTLPDKNGGTATQGGARTSNILSDRIQFTQHHPRPPHTRETPPNYGARAAAAVPGIEWGTYSCLAQMKYNSNTGMYSCCSQITNSHQERGVVAIFRHKLDGVVSGEPLLEQSDVLLTVGRFEKADGVGQGWRQSLAAGAFEALSRDRSFHISIRF